MSNSGTPAGWYPDPENPGQSRYWDGAAWAAPSAPSGQVGATPGPPTGGASSNKRILIVVGLVLAAILVGGGAYALTSGGGDDDDGENIATQEDEADEDDEGDTEDEGEEEDEGDATDVVAEDDEGGDSDGAGVMPDTPGGGFAFPASREEYIDLLVDSGLSRDQAECFADALEDQGIDFDDLTSSDPGDFDDFDDFDDIARDCFDFGS